MPELSTIRIGDALPTREDAPRPRAIFFFLAALWKSDDASPGAGIPPELPADWMVQCALTWAGDKGRLLEFRHTPGPAAITGERFTTGGEVSAIDPDAAQCTVELFVHRHDGETIHAGEARLQLT